MARRGLQPLCGAALLGRAGLLTLHAAGPCLVLASPCGPPVKCLATMRAVWPLFPPCPRYAAAVPQRNYRTFLLFVYTTTVLCLYVFGCCLAQLFVRHNELVDEAKAAGTSSSNAWGKTVSQVRHALKPCRHRPIHSSRKRREMRPVSFQQGSLSAGAGTGVGAHEKRGQGMQGRKARQQRDAFDTSPMTA